MFKSKTMVIKARHDWGVEGTKQRITERFETLRKNFLGLVSVPDFSWDGDVGQVRVRALGQTVNAVCDVKPENLTITIELPWLLSHFAGPLQGFIDSHGDVLKSKPLADGTKPIMEPLPFHKRLFRSKPQLEAKGDRSVAPRKSGRK